MNIDETVENILDKFVSIIGNSGIGDAWCYYEEEYKQEDLKELRSYIKEILKQIDKEHEDETDRVLKSQQEDMYMEWPVGKEHGD